MNARARQWRGLHAGGKLALALIAALALAGCQTTARQGTALHTGSITPSLKEMRAYKERYRRDPGDVRAGLGYAAQLKALGQLQERTRVLADLARRHPRRTDLQLLHARALLEANRPAPAESIYRGLLARGVADWRVLDGLGSALAAQGRHADAREQYRRALKLSPDNARVINNMAMSHILEGDPGRAERLLRAALQTARRGRENDAVSVRLRQNLALAVGLQGRFEEARRIASHDLPAPRAAANMAYLRRMLGADTGLNTDSGNGGPGVLTGG